MKVGDKIVCEDAKGQKILVEGQTYTVRKIDGEDRVYIEEHKRFSYLQKRFSIKPKVIKTIKAYVGVHLVELEQLDHWGEAYQIVDKPEYHSIKQFGHCLSGHNVLDSAVIENILYKLQLLLDNKVKIARRSAYYNDSNLLSGISSIVSIGDNGMYIDCGICEFVNLFRIDSSLREKLYSSWPHYSGHYTYPVGGIREYRVRKENDGGLWGNPLRWTLVEHLKVELTNLLETLK